jgi:outer membrane protein TolC
LNASVGLQYTFAPANDVAKGQLEMANSAISSAKAQLDDLERSVRSSIIVSVENLRSSVLRLRTTGETVDSYRMALDGEREKLKLGVSSLTDVVLAEDRLNTALLAQVDAQVTYSQGIAQMRFAIGALVPATGPIQSVNVNLLRTVPGSMQAGDN